MVGRAVRWGHAWTCLARQASRLLRGCRPRSPDSREGPAALWCPVYVRKQIVHNTHVVRSLEQRGAIFVDETAEIPDGAVVVFSAHGVAPEVYEDAERRR